MLNPPYLLFYPDRNNDDVPDSDPEVHLQGFGLEDTHSVVNSLLGPRRLALRRTGIDRHRPRHSPGTRCWQRAPPLDGTAHLEISTRDTSPTANWTASGSVTPLNGTNYLNISSPPISLRLKNP